ncbi:hypothetical protein B4079_4760 [Bacillus cereus]|nr:hypothetical protein bcere0009_14670 [Bacillus cereus R309803]EEL25358.1 hypothetical protein bcere0018_56190 [Bacillus cereus Rock1-15]EEL84935.1 hypothetical protein bcere0029_53080 [Bacillus cereus AH1272]EEL94415.1 hypothetical protein bcere0030_15390 [Bacillus cereus AH1273]KYQ00086.1 hypothetical protein B4079_4760 [Bacillus cereus]
MYEATKKESLIKGFNPGKYKERYINKKNYLYYNIKTNETY